MFEVHYWPVTGRIKLIHNPPGTALGDIVTTLTLDGETGSADLADATFIVALSLAKAGDPGGELLRHIALETVRQRLDNLDVSPASPGQAEVMPV